MIPLDILSDPICPWCWIGKTYLDRALEREGDTPFGIAWHPFQLNPDMPAEGMDRADYLETKFGGKSAAAEVYGRIDKAAQQAGLNIDWPSIPRTPNTLDAHRLIHWAGIEGRQNAVVDRLFFAYFKEFRDIGDRAVLTAIAAEAGMDGDVTARLLDSTADRDDIAARDADARAKGVSGVPTFVLANAQILTGAQPVEMWQHLIGEVGELLNTGE